MITLPLKKSVILTASVVTLGALGGTAFMIQNKPNAGADTSPIVTTLDNHETRIRNNENDIRTLQTATGTQPNPSNESVPVVNSTSTQSATPVETVIVSSADVATITKVEQIPVSDEVTDCKFTYSDGTTHQWHWKTVKDNVTTTVEYSDCDDSLLGKLKV